MPPKDDAQTIRGACSRVGWFPTSSSEPALLRSGHGLKEGEYRSFQRPGRADNLLLSLNLALAVTLYMHRRKRFLLDSMVTSQCVS